MSTRSFKWITNDVNENTGHIRMHDVRNVFQPISRSPCNLISIFGRARQGKSFLMNCLAGETDVFRISNEKESCTQGIDISNKWLSLKEFSGIDRGDAIKSESTIRVGFVDAEGQGDKDVSYDAKLICPILLVSKCIIFNWKGDLQKDHILSTLGIMTRAAQNVSMDTSVNRKHKFGHLHIVFRDWQSVGSDEKSTFDALFKFEGIAEASTRDKIRSDVRDSFESIQVHLFDAPTELVSDLRKKLTIDKTSASFRNQVRRFREVLTNQLKNPTFFADQPLLGKSYPSMINQVVDSLNRGEVILPSSAYLSMMRLELEKIVREYEKEIKQQMDNYADELKNYITNSDYDIFPNKSAAVKKLTESFNIINSKYENEVIPSSIGDITGDLQAQIMSNYPNQTKAIQNNFLEQFVSIYGQLLGQWLINSRKSAEIMINDGVKDLEKHLPFNEDELNHKLNELWISALLKISSLEEKERNQQNNNKNNNNLSPELVDAQEILSRHFQLVSSKVKELNKDKIHIMTQQSHKLLDEAKNLMNKVGGEVLDEMRAIHTKGFLSELYFRQLDNKYIEISNYLLKSLGQSFFTENVIEEFKKYASSLRGKMKDNYEQLKDSVFKNTVSDSKIRIYKNCSDLSSRFIANPQLSSAEFEHELNGLIEHSAREIFDGISGWITEQDTPGVLDSLRQHLFDETRVQRDNITEAIEVRSKYEHEMEMARNAKLEEELNYNNQDDVEEEYDDDDHNMSNHMNADENPKQSLSAASQKAKAQQWAAKQFGLKAVGGTKKTKGKAAPVPMKSVEQQRKDAAEFAKKKFGISSVKVSPPRPPTPPLPTNENDGSSKRRRSSVGGGMDTSGSVRGLSIIAAAQEEARLQELERINIAAANAMNQNKKKK
eukprot:gene15826-21440_t